MWIKGAGCLLIVASTTGFGYFKGMEYKKQMEEMERLRQVIWLLRGEMKYTRTSLSEICKKVAKKLEMPYKNWLESIANQLRKKEHIPLGVLWKEETDKFTKKLHLPEEERRELAILGYQLGHIDIEMQENALLWFENNLEEKRKRLAERVEEKRKLCNCLGVMSGVLFVILIW